MSGRRNSRAGRSHAEARERAGKLPSSAWLPPSFRILSSQTSIIPDYIESYRRTQGQVLHAQETLRPSASARRRTDEAAGKRARSVHRRRRILGGCEDRGRPAMKIRSLSSGLKASYRGSNVSRRAQRFENRAARASSEGATTDYDHAETVREYYDLCSEFMVFGWGESLHFAPLSPHESLEESMAGHQRLIISKLELRPGMLVIDVGCGVGGPMRRVVREAGVRVLGADQVHRHVRVVQITRDGARLRSRAASRRCRPRGIHGTRPPRRPRASLPPSRDGRAEPVVALGRPIRRPSSATGGRRGLGIEVLFVFEQDVQSLAHIAWGYSAHG